MRILLDTHTLLWAARGTLSPVAQDLLEDTANELYFSSINLWEIEIKRQRLKLDSKAFYQNLIRNGYRELMVSARHVIALSMLPLRHQDPFDRMLIAQAMSEQLFFLTADETIKQYSHELDFIIGFD